MKKILLATIIASGFAATALAASNPAKDRQLLMKNVGAAVGVGGKMAKGEMEFNAAAAQLVLKTFNAGAHGFGYLFPEGSETGEETEAAPAIWSDRAGFDAAIAKFAADTTGTVTDLDSFKAEFGKATANCGSCHKAFRIKKQ